MSTSAIQRAPTAAAVSAAINTAQIFPAAAPLGSIGAAAAALIAAMLPVPGSNRLEQKRWAFRASGIATTAGAYTAVLTLYAAVAQPAATLTPGSWTAIATTGAVAIGTTTAGWILEGEAMFDTVSGKLIGSFSSNINNTFAGSAALTQLTGISGVTEPAMLLAVGITFSTANAGNIGRMADFALDA